MAFITDLVYDPATAELVVTRQDFAAQPDGTLAAQGQPAQTRVSLAAPGLRLSFGTVAAAGAGAVNFFVDVENSGLVPIDNSEVRLVYEAGQATSRVNFNGQAYPARFEPGQRRRYLLPVNQPIPGGGPIKPSVLGAPPGMCRVAVEVQQQEIARIPDADLLAFCQAMP